MEAGGKFGHVFCRSTLRLTNYPFIDVDSEVEDSSNVYCYPHNARRNPNMDARCFEVKWAHRDDCVNALMVGITFCYQMTVLTPS